MRQEVAPESFAVPHDAHLHEVPVSAVSELPLDPLTLASSAHDGA
jgi:hypothetical protein